MLRRIPEKILIDALSATTVQVAGGIVSFEGYGDIDPANVLNCYKACPSACVAEVVIVTPVIPVSCECPYEWGIYIECLPCPGSYEVQTTFGSKKFYGWQNPSGATPTVAEVVINLVANINNDPFACVTAVNTGGLNTSITLTEKDCNSSCGFTVTIADSSGTVVITTPHNNGVMTAIDMAKLFPIQWGHPGSRPSIAYCNNYCVYHFVVRDDCDAQDISAANHYNCYEREVYFFLNSGDPLFAATDALLLANFPCLT